MPTFSRCAMIAILLTAAPLEWPAASAQSREDSVSAAVRKAGEKREPIITASDRALIARKCGYASPEAEHNTNFSKGALVCEDGRRVEDAETRALAARVSKRAREYVEAVMRDPAVRRAIDGTATRAAREALVKVRASLERLSD